MLPKTPGPWQPDGQGACCAARQSIHCPNVARHDPTRGGRRNVGSSPSKVALMAIFFGTRLARLFLVAIRIGEIPIWKRCPQSAKWLQVQVCSFLTHPLRPHILAMDLGAAPLTKLTTNRRKGLSVGVFGGW